MHFLFELLYIRLNSIISARDTAHIVIMPPKITKPKIAYSKMNTRSSISSSHEESTTNDESQDMETELTCIGSCGRTFSSKDDHMLACERCEKWICRECTNMSADMYRLLTDRPNMHWFCKACDSKVMAAVITDLDVETKCQKYCE